MDGLKSKNKLKDLVTGVLKTKDNRPKANSTKKSSPAPISPEARSAKTSSATKQDPPPSSSVDVVVDAEDQKQAKCSPALGRFTPLGDDGLPFDSTSASPDHKASTPQKSKSTPLASTCLSSKPRAESKDTVSSASTKKGGFKPKKKITWSDIQKQMQRLVWISLQHCTKDDRRSIKDRANSFQIFGYDFMVDFEGNVWLIECNGAPDLTFSTTTTRELVAKMLPNMTDVIVHEERMGPDKLGEVSRGEYGKPGAVKSRSPESMGKIEGWYQAPTRSMNTGADIWSEETTGSPVTSKNGLNTKTRGFPRTKGESVVAKFQRAAEK